MSPSTPIQSSRKASLKRLLSLARPELVSLGLGVICLGIGSVAGLLFPQAIRFIVDGALGETSGWTVDRAALALALLSLIQAIASAVRFSLFTIAGERIVARLRAHFFDRLLCQEIAFFDERKTGELTTRLASDTTVLQSAVSMNISMALRFSVNVIGGIALLFYTSSRLTLVMLLVVPPVALGAFSYGRRVRKLSRDAQDELARSGEVAEETLAGIRTVRTFAAEKNELRRYTAAVDKAFGVAKKRVLTAATFMGTASFAAYGAASLVLWSGGGLVSQGKMTPGELTSFLVYTLFVAFSLGGISDLWADLMKAIGAAERIFEIVDRQPSIPIEGGAELDRVAGRIVFERVEFSYPSRQDVVVLRGIDLTIEPGEVVAIVGPSGAGKSTIASLMLRLYDPTSGRILLDGHDLRSLSPDGLRRTIGVVSQEPVLFSTSVAENIRYGRADAQDDDVQRAANAANAHEFITKFPDRYQTQVGERGVQLSGGQKQRVAIARAVLKDPRILVLDEATSALDAESEHLVKEALDRLMKGRTTLIIAHRLSTVMDADRVVVLDEGRIVESGDHLSLMGKGGLYRKLVERQFVVEPARDLAAN